MKYTEKYKGKTLKMIDERCPHCKEDIDWDNDLDKDWDWGNGSPEGENDMECPYCEKEIIIEVEASISYSVAGVWK